MLSAMQPSDYPFCVLLVEDQEIILENIRQQLIDNGFEVIAASSAEEACVQIARHGERIGAAFLDVDLGEGEDGFCVARQVRAAQPDAKIVYTSGGIRGGLLNERVENSVFVPKPYMPSQIGFLLCDMLSLVRTEADNH